MAIFKAWGIRFNQHKVRNYFLIAFVVLFIALSALSGIFNSGLPPVDGVAAAGAVSSKIYDRNGVLLYEIHGETKRTPVVLSEISQNLINATLAIEDKNFYKHYGLSITSIIRAAYANFKAKEITQGGSTITQQLVKLSLLTREQSWERKIKEAVLSLKVEQKYDKDQILEMYLNAAPYGRNTYGAEAASLAYFAKNAKDLTLAESAYLAALPKAPSMYSPTGNNSSELDKRKNLILDLMHKHKYISKEVLDAAKQEKVTFSRGKTELAAPYFVKWIESALEQKYGREVLESDGFEIYTTLDSKLQTIGEKAVEEGAARNTARYNAHNASLVAIEPKTGHILAMVGGKDYFAQPEPAGCKPGINCTFDPQTNVATSMRQPGSSFKPYTYVTAFSPKFGYAPASRILDRATTFSGHALPYRPVNYNKREYGLISMRKALAGSLNISAVRTLSMIGVGSVVETVKAMGITTPMEQCGLSLTLGACEVKLVEHVAAFSVFANMGEKAETTSIIKIIDKYGNTISEHKNNLTRAIDPEAAYQVVDIMSDNNARSFIFGSRSPLVLPDRKVAAKTGTSQDFKDGWTIGFVPQLAAGVWAGNNNSELMKKNADGVVVAAPIWNKFMKEALASLPAENFTIPSGIQQIKVSARSGKIATTFTTDPVNEIFASYSLPKQKDPYTPPPVIDPIYLVGGVPTLGSILNDLGGAVPEPVPEQSDQPPNNRQRRNPI